MTMRRLELIANLQKRMPEQSIQDISQLLNTLFGEITNALEQGERVELREFGSFGVKELKAHLGKDPRTGTEIYIEERYRPFFKASSKLLEE
jgi:integration host factor subunit beta